MSSPHIQRQPGRQPGARNWTGATPPAPRAAAFDGVIERFRARWETDASYRARVSVTAGAAALIGLCLFAAVVGVIANRAFGGGGPPSPSSLAQSSGGGGQLQGFASYPTPSLPPWTPGTIGGGAPVPASQTPVPKPTSAAKATPTVDPGKGNGTPTPTSGGLPTTCNGRSGSTTWDISPCPQVAGQGGTLTIHSPGSANAPVNVLISFGVCNPSTVSCTYTFLPSQYSLDGSGNITLSYTVPAAAANNTAPVSGMVNIQGGPSFSYTAAPVQ